MQAHRHGEDMEQRRLHDAFVARPRRQRRFPLADVHRHLPMADVDALRQPGGAAGILQGRKIVGRRQRLEQTPLLLVLADVKRTTARPDPHHVRDAEAAASGSTLPAMSAS